MNPDASNISEDMAWREIRQGTYRVDIWEQALAEAQGDPIQAREAYIRLRTQTLRTDMGRMLAQHIRAALSEDERRPPDFKSARDLGRRP
jgi:hypothetical protein